MKTVYFIRHGESEGNVGGKWQDSTATLTPNGREQAALVANRLVSYPIDIIISSTMKRAVQTADIIADQVKKSIETTDLLIERRRPSEQLGVDKSDQGAVHADSEIKEHFDEEGFRYSDEENFADLKKRVKSFFEYLDGRTEENILVITHEIFLRMIVAYIALGKNITGHEGKQFFRTFHMENTGITIVSKNLGDNESTWDLNTWNDYSHLANINTNSTSH